MACSHGRVGLWGNDMDRRLMLKGVGIDSAYWNNRVGYFNTEYTPNNNWWDSAESGIQKTMNNVKKSAETQNKRYFLIFKISGDYYCYVTDYVIYTKIIANKLWLLFGADVLRMDAWGSTNRWQHGDNYQERDGVQYVTDSTTRTYTTFQTAVTNAPIFDWDEIPPKSIPKNGGAIKIY